MVTNFLSIFWASITSFLFCDCLSFPVSILFELLLLIWVLFHFEGIFTLNLKTVTIQIGKVVCRRGIISQKLFTLALKDIFKHLDWENKKISINSKFINHPRFFDDILIISYNPDVFCSMVNQLYLESEKNEPAKN